MAMKLVALLRAEGYSLAVAQIFSNPTLSGMASKMQPTTSDGQKSLPTHTSLPDSVVDDVLRSKVATSHNFDLSRVEDVYPCTYMQKSFMEDSIQVPGAQVVQFIFALDSGVDLSRLHTAVDRCVRDFPILRTRLVRESGQLYQVVFSDKIVWKEVTAGSLSKVLAEDKLIPTGLGDALTRISIVHETEKSGAHLIWTLHHSLYDAWSLRLLLDAVDMAYKNQTFGKPPQMPFKSLVEYVGSRDKTKDRSFWASYLAGAGSSPLFGYIFLRNPVKDMRADYQLPLPRKVHGTTLTATIASAWIQVVGNLTKSQDVTIGYLVTGRAASLPGIQNCVGPVISKVPLRVRLGSGDNTAIVSEKVQAELSRLMPYELSGLEAVKASSQDATDACRFPLDLTVHPTGTLAFAGEGIGMRFVGGEVAAAPPGGFAVECAIKDDGMEVAVFWDKRAGRKEHIDVLLQSFEAILVKS